MSEIEKYRKQIDMIDEKLLILLNKRGEIAKKIGDLKRKEKIEIYKPSRENQIIERLKTITTIFNPESIELIWKEIMGACKAIQGNMLKVGFLGPKGTFTHQESIAT